MDKGSLALVTLNFIEWIPGSVKFNYNAKGIRHSQVSSKLIEKLNSVQLFYAAQRD